MYFDFVKGVAGEGDCTMCFVGKKAFIFFRRRR